MRINTVNDRIYFIRKLGTKSTQIGGGGTFKNTLNLPTTKFPIRSNPIEREPVLKTVCVTDLYTWQKEKLNDKKLFTLHDGPPFANGSLHIGHFLNKVLKDIVNRYKLLQVTYFISFINA